MTHGHVELQLDKSLVKEKLGNVSSCVCLLCYTYQLIQILGFKLRLRDVFRTEGAE